MVCCSNPGCNIIAHAHCSGENKRLIFNAHCFIGKTYFEIAHDDTFRGMFAETNNLVSQQKKTTCRRHRLYKAIRKQYIAIIEGNNNLTHSNKNKPDLEGTSDKENNNVLHLSHKRQLLIALTTLNEYKKVYCLLNNTSNAY